MIFLSKINQQQKLELLFAQNKIVNIVALHKLYVLSLKHRKLVCWDIKEKPQLK